MPPQPLWSSPFKTEVNRELLRCPIPTKCGEEKHPGSVCEKLRCETASYIWMQQHCSDVRIPHLYGFGSPDGAHFSFARCQSMVRRAVVYIRQVMASWLRRSVGAAHKHTRVFGYWQWWTDFELGDGGELVVQPHMVLPLVHDHRCLLHITEGRIQSVPEDPPYAYFCRLWHKDAKAIEARKLQDREEYKLAVARLFQDTE